MEQVKSLIKDHLEKNKFFDTLKSAVSKDPKLANVDRNQIIEKLKQEGVLNDILQSIPIKRNPPNINQSDSLSKSSVDQFKHKGRHLSFSRAATQHENLDPNKRYLSCRLVQGKAFVDFINPRDDEFLSVSISFLKNRFHSKHVHVSSDPVFDETFIFEFVGENEQIKFDPSMLLKLN